MIGRIFLALIFIGSLVWIGFVGFDILSVKSNYAPHETFGFEDQNLLVVNRPNEVQFESLESFSNSPLLDVCSKLNTEEYAKGFFSFKRSHFILKRSDNWTEENIESLFKGSTVGSFDGSKFKIDEFNGRYFKTSLYVSKGEIQSPKVLLDKESFKIDIKSSVSIISMNREKVTSISDVYFLPSGRINYVSANDNDIMGKQVKDEVLFSSVVSSKFSKYHFWERDFLSSTDSVFANSPMAQWCLNGVLELEYKGSRVLVTDYIDGQDPILILNDLFQSTEASVFNVPLTNNFPSEGKPFHIKYLEDLIVISESETVCDKVIGDFKLGNTIALNQDVKNMVYGRLPKSISERFVSETSSYSKSVYRDKILQTQFGSATAIAIPSKSETISIIVGLISLIL